MLKDYIAGSGTCWRNEAFCQNGSPCRSGVGDNTSPLNDDSAQNKRRTDN